MGRFARLLVAVGIVAATVSLSAGAARAQSRTWVSGTGNDAYPCSYTAPCKTFAGAYAKTAAGGEINCLDAGAYGPVSITKSIAISCEAGTAGVVGIQGLGNIGILVNVGASDVVYLRGLDIEGFGSQGIGIEFTGAGQLHVEKCLIRGFAYGVNATASGALFVSDTVVDRNVSAPGNGIVIAPNSGPASAVLERVQLTYNNAGVSAFGKAGATPVLVSITDSIASHNNNGYGFFAESTGGGGVLMQINRSTASQNSTGVYAIGPQAQAIIGESLVSQNATGVAAGGNAKIYSYQNNQINGNATDGTPIPPVSLE